MGQVAIPIAVGATQDEVAAAIVTALANAAGLNLAPRNLGNGQVHLGSLDGHTVNLVDSALTLEGDADGIRDGDVFSISNGGLTVNFEFDNNGSLVNPTHEPINFLRTNTHTELAGILAAAIASSGIGLPGTTDLLDGRVNLGGTTAHGVDLRSSPLTLSGQPGVTSSLVLSVPAGGVGPGGVLDGHFFTVTRGTTSVEFEFDVNGTVSPGRVSISVGIGNSANQVANAIVAVLNGANNRKLDTQQLWKNS